MGKAAAIRADEHRYGWVIVTVSTVSLALGFGDDFLGVNGLGGDGAHEDCERVDIEPACGVASVCRRGEDRP